jgi:hypothetical protein
VLALVHMTGNLSAWALWNPHSYDILGAGMLWKPKEARKFVKIRDNLLKFVKIRVEEYFNKVLYHVNSQILK